MTAKEIREKMDPLRKELRKLADEHSADPAKWDAAKEEAWVRVNKEYDTLNASLERVEKVEKFEADAAKSVGQRGVGRDDIDGRETRRQEDRQRPAQPTDEHRALALQAWFRHETRRELTQEHRDACSALNFNPAVRELALPMLSIESYNQLQRTFQTAHPSMVTRYVNELRTLTIGSGPLRGYLIPPETLIRNLEVNMLAFGGVRQVAETIRTSSGEPLSWPTADDTSNTGAQLGESTSIGSSVDPSFAKVRWDAYKFSSKPILVPYELLEDSAFNLPSILGTMLGERLGRITNTKYTTGTGAATPKGIVTAATAFSAASATAIAGDDILGLVHSIDPAYRTMGCGFMMHDSILLVLRKLKDGNGQYLWQSGIQQGAPDRLLSYQITNNQDMDSTVASGKKTILFGLLSNYKIRTVNGMRMYRLQERYRDTDQDAFIAFIREDGNLLNAGTANVKYLSH
jgi:HK97 family phage major capsid protein